MAEQNIETLNEISAKVTGRTHIVILCAPLGAKKVLTHIDGKIWNV